jgi:hypothetical protein
MKPTLKSLKMLPFGALLAVLSSTSSKVAQAQDFESFNEAERLTSANVVDLKDQLYFGLRTFQPSQQAFLDQVITKVENKELSRAFVNVVFVWAKKRNPKIPFPYFEIAMRMLAEKRGVTFP